VGVTVHPGAFSGRDELREEDIDSVESLFHGTRVTLQIKHLKRHAPVSNILWTL
jgi:hypothetical protein